MCTVGKKDSASRRSLTRQHRVSPVRIPQSQRRLRYSFLWPAKRGPSPFVTEPSVVPRSGMPSLMYLRTSRSTERWPLFTFFLPLCFILPALVPPCSIPQARLFSLQSSIAGCLPCQVPLALAAGKSSSPTRRRAYFPRPPCPGLPPILRAEK